MTSICQDDAVWKALAETEAPQAPVEAMTVLIEACRKDSAVEDKLISDFEICLKETESDSENLKLWWLILILAEAKSVKAIPALLKCFDDEEADILLDVLVFALARLGEPAVRALMKWFEGNPFWGSRIWAYAALENALEFGSPELLGEIKLFLKQRVAEEEKSESERGLVDQVLHALAAFSPQYSDVLPFMRQVIRRYDYNAEFADALAAAEGRLKYPDEKILEKSWQDFARQQAKLTAWDEKKSLEIDQREALLEEMNGFSIETDAQRLAECLPEFKKLFPKSETADYLEALILHQSGKKEEAKLRIQRAEEQAEKEWANFPEARRYERVRNICFAADLILDRQPEVSFLPRIADYVEGVLLETGAVPLTQLHKHLGRMDTGIKTITESVFREALQRSGRFKFYGQQVVLMDVPNIEELLREREKNNFKPKLRKKLSEIKLLQEGRAWYFYGPSELQLDQDIRIMTQGFMDLEKVRREIRKDVTGQECTDALFAKLRLFRADFEELMTAVSEAWDITSRWEFGGRTPEEAVGKKPEA